MTAPLNVEEKEGQGKPKIQPGKWTKCCATTRQKRHIKQFKGRGTEKVRGGMADQVVTQGGGGQAGLWRVDHLDWGTEKKTAIRAVGKKTPKVVPNSAQGRSFFEQKRNL